MHSKTDLVDDEVKSLALGGSAPREHLVHGVLLELLKEVGLVLKRARAESGSCGAVISLAVTKWAPPQAGGEPSMRRRLKSIGPMSSGSFVLSPLSIPRRTMRPSRAREVMFFAQ